MVAVNTPIAIAPTITAVIMTLFLLSSIKSFETLAQLTFLMAVY